MPDHAFKPDAELDRNVILYGSADTNRAWKSLLGDSPVQVHRGRVVVGDRVERGTDLACLFIRPRPGSDRACVGAICGTGITGMRLTNRLPIFLSGVGYPDCVILDSTMPEKGAGGVRAAGFFGIDWSVTAGEFKWRE